ncbi:MAG: methylisocitrate lyase [Methyloligellaceae bacterium]
MFATTDAHTKRRALRDGLASGKLLRYPGAFSPLVAKEVEHIGFEGVYISGAALSADLGLPDIGLTTLSEVAGRGHQIARVTTLPSVIDADTGFGVPLNAARTIQTLEHAGLAGCHIEDQVNPKRCGHLENKTVVSRVQMAQRLKGAADARTDPDFVIIARTDARAIEGLDKAIDRAKAYVDAGADVVFPEALEDEREFDTFRQAIDVPLLANLTEFGKSPLLDTATLEALGYNMVIYPVTTLRLAMKATGDGLRQIYEAGTQSDLVPAMQTRQELYELLGYQDYASFDASVADYGGAGSDD